MGYDAAKKLPAVNNTVQMMGGVANIIEGTRDVNPASGLGPYLAPLALWGGSENLGTGIGKMVNGEDGGTMQALGGLGGVTAGGIGTAGLLANTLVPGGTLATAIGGGTTATAGGAGLATSVTAAGALPIAATVGAGLAAGVTIGNGINSLADSEYNPFMDEQGRGTDDRWQQSIIDNAIANGEDPSSTWNVIKGGLAGTAGTLIDGTAAAGCAVWSAVTSW